MANPRSKVMFNQISPDRTTYKADGTTILFDKTQNGGSASVGKCVRMTGTPGVVSLTVDASYIIGVIESVEADLVCTILTGDYVQVPFAAAATIGARCVGALLTAAPGYARAAVAATLSDVVNQRGIVVDITDNLNPWVFFG